MAMKTKGRFMSSLQTILWRLLEWTQVLENFCEGKSKTSLSLKNAAKLNLTANCWQKERSEMDAHISFACRPGVNGTRCLNQYREQRMANGRS